MYEDETEEQSRKKDKKHKKKKKKHKRRDSNSEDSDEGRTAKKVSEAHKSTFWTFCYISVYTGHHISNILK